MFFMRHGQSTFNVVMDRTGIDPRIPDAPLSDTGKRQVHAAAHHFKKPIELIVCSPYTRAIESAHIFAEKIPVPIKIDIRVGEQRIYSCDIGSPVESLQAAWPALDFSMVPQGEWWQPFPEERRTLMHRANTFLDEWFYSRKPPPERVLVISHWYFINAVTRANPDNAKIIEFGV